MESVRQPGSGSSRSQAHPPPSLNARVILENPQYCSVFKQFLDGEGLAQTVLFLVEVEEFRRIPSFDFQLLRAKKIFTKFMHEVCVMPVPVTCFTRAEILQCIAGGVVLPTLYKVAAEEVVRYIEIFQFPRFLQSPDMNRIACMIGADQSRPQESHLPRRASLSVSAVHLPNTLALRSILQNQQCTRYLKDFSAKTLCSENVLFWLDVDNYKNLPGSDYMRRVACKIYKKYVADGAKMQINISFPAKEAIFDSLLSTDRQLFRKAQQEVLALMESDTLPKFRKSPEYALMLQMLQTDRLMVRSPSDLSPESGGRRRSSLSLQASLRSTPKPVAARY
ncbi:RGS domain-containing protein [Ochromonadaceae sp. CCMP2298]|nr:RGS domain-containing protein [Ochromonadaceae sp. CCMP2298]